MRLDEYPNALVRGMQVGEDKMSIDDTIKPVKRHLTLKERLSIAEAEIVKLKEEVKDQSKRADHHYWEAIENRKRMDSEVLRAEKYKEIADFILGYPERKQARDNMGNRL